MTVRIRYEWVPGQREELVIRADGDGWWQAVVGDQTVGRVRVDSTLGGPGAHIDHVDRAVCATVGGLRRTRPRRVPGSGRPVRKAA